MSLINKFKFINYITKGNLAYINTNNTIHDIIENFRLPDTDTLTKDLILHLIADDENNYIKKLNKNNIYNSFEYTPLYNFFKLFLIECYNDIITTLLDEDYKKNTKKPKYNLKIKLEDTKKDLDIIYLFWDKYNILPLMNSYSGMGYTDVLFYDILCEELFICKMGGSNGFDVNNNIKMLQQYCNKSLEEREILLQSIYMDDNYVNIFEKYILGDTHENGYKKYYGEIDLHNKHLNFTTNI
jgi:hypothetical protein